MSKLFFDKKDYNTVLFESERFIVIPSLGSLVEGWLLVIPKQFYLNLAQMDEVHREEMGVVIEEIKKRLLPLFGEKFVLFEHGPQQVGSKVGCGVDYAHLHVVPFGADLIQGVKDFLGLDYKWQQIPNIASLYEYGQGGMDYLFLQDQTGQCHLTFQESIKSQTFRQVIATYLGRAAEFDWKCNFQKDIIHATINKLTYSEI